MGARSSDARTFFDRLSRLDEDLPNRYLAVMILVQLRRLPPGNLGECPGKLGVVKLLVRGRGGDHDAARPGEGRQKPARSRGREPEDLLAACDAIKQCGQLVIAQVGAWQMEEDVLAPQVRMPQEEHPEPAIGGKRAAGWPRRLR